MKQGIQNRRKKWLARVGSVAFLVFLFKGLMWLAVPSVLALHTCR
jgi:hypothetical protein